MDKCRNSYDPQLNMPVIKLKYLFICLKANQNKNKKVVFDSLSNTKYNWWIKTLLITIIDNHTLWIERTYILKYKYW